MKKRHSYDPNRLKFFLKVMKAYALLLVITLTRLAAFEASGQSISIDMQNVELSSILLKIEEKSEYRFFYSNNLIDVDTPYSLRVQDAEIEDVLEVLFDNKPIAYRFLDKQIVLFPENETQTAAHVDALINKEKAKPLDKIKGINRLAEQLQQRTVRGTVSDQEGLPLPGVSVVVKGTSRGVTTDFDGAFQIRVPDSGATLVFSYVGMDTQEVNIDEQTTITVRMMPKTGQLDEVILTGYQTLERERVTGSVSKLESEDLNRVVSENVASAIEATTAGVLVQNNVQGEPEISIRGVSSLIGANAPLIVVDGFPVNSGELRLDLTNRDLATSSFRNIDEFDTNSRGSFLRTLNPKDIKSITVLKDAAAASIWGVRSANGVIVIETYNGKGATKDELNMSYSFDTSFGLDKPDLSDLYLMNASDIVDLRREGYTKTDVSSSSGASVIRLFSTSSYDIMDAVFRDLNSGAITQNQADSRLNALKDLDYESQFEAYFLRPERFERHNLTASGRNDNVNYLLSLTYSNNERVETNNDEEEYLVRAALGIQDFLAPNLDLDFSYTTSFTERKLNHIPINYFARNAAYDVLVDDQGDLTWQYLGSNREVLPHDYETYDDLGYLDWRYNLLREFRAKDSSTSNQMNRLQGTLSYQLHPGINISTQYQYERSSLLQEDLQTLERHEVRRSINTFTTVSAEGDLEYHFPFRPALRLADADLKSWVWRNTLNYDFDIAQKGKIAGVVGHEMQQSTGDYVRQSVWGYDPISLIHIPIDYDTLINVGIPGFDGRTRRLSTLDPFTRVFTDSRYLSGFANLGFTWDDTYDLSVSGRVDQTNFFGVNVDERSSPFWSVGGGWLLSNEAFIQNIDWIDHLKLRTTYGVNGNVTSTDGSVLVTNSELRRDTGEIVLEIQSLPNPNLSWESVATTNIGLDFGLLNHRLWGSLEYYNKKASDLLATAPFNITYGPALSFFNTEFQYNVGEITNEGMDIQLNMVPIEQNHFRWQSNLNFSWATSEVGKVNTSNSTSPDQAARNTPFTIARGIFREGDPADALYVYRLDGLDDDGSLRVFDIDGEVVPYVVTNVNSGAMRKSFSEANLEKYVAGVFNPKYFGGWINTFSYKNFDLSLTFSYKLGHVMRGPVRGLATPNYFNYRSYSRILADRWKTPDDNGNTDIPAVDRNFSTIRIYNYSDSNIDKADFVRLSYLSLGYQMPDELFVNSFVKSMRLNLQFSNLWIWTANRWNLDPEYYGGIKSGTPNGFSPPATSTLSLNINF